MTKLRVLMLAGFLAGAGLGAWAFSLHATRAARAQDRTTAGPLLAPAGTIPAAASPALSLAAAGQPTVPAPAPQPTPAAPAGPTSPLTAPKVVSITDENKLTWPVPGSGIKVTSVKFIINVESYTPPAGATVSLWDVTNQQNLDFSSPPTTAFTSLTPVNLKTQLKPAQTYTLTVRVTPTASAPPVDSNPFTVTVSGGQPVAPGISRVTNGQYADPVPVPTDANTKLNLYGRTLRLEGSSAYSGSSLEFEVFDSTNQRYTQPTVRSLSPLTDAGTWKAEVYLPPVAAAFNGTLYAWVRKNDQYSFPSNAVAFKMVAPDRLAAPSITELAKDSTKAETKFSAGPKAGVFYGNVLEFDVKLSAITGLANPADTQLLVFYDRAPEPIGKVSVDKAGSTPVVRVKLPVEGEHQLFAALAQGDQDPVRSAPVTVVVRTRGPQVLGVTPPILTVPVGPPTLTIQFDRNHLLRRESAENTDNYWLKPSKAGAAKGPSPKSARLDSTANAVVLTFGDLDPDTYQLVVQGTPPAQAASGATPSPSPAPAAAGSASAPAATPPAPNLPATSPTATSANSGLQDVFGNFLEGVPGQPGSNFVIEIVKPTGAELPSVSGGITGQTGPYVEFKEYLDPRPPSNGFNPSDHVETRVARLYYFRDAHRVAQIINREVKSYNYVAVEVRRRLADKARDVANQLTDQRRLEESRAERAARDARQAERDLQQEQANLARAQQIGATAQLDLNRVNQQLADPTLNPSQRPDLLTRQQNAQQVAASAAAAAQAAADRVQAAAAAVQATREKEVQEAEAVQVKAADEGRAREEQFRREVAAAHEDPDTYAPGKPDSVDPVRQVSVSVIGEGVIQLRGPIKGMNIIRLMINQIDAPVGQVRVAVHTVQVNGEHGDRMEKVAGRIQRYIDHSRFLTAQSGQILRKAVVLVAGRKADEVALTCPNDSQEARDQKYLYAFFGKDFTDELRALDSEFLKTGNKLLSLHSMDTTSLASALFLLALAKNSTRLEILQEFQRMMADELPGAEQSYFLASSPEKDCKEFLFFADNARFQSLLGFFNAEVSGADTMNPIQREFVRLAQIFKSQLTTELEYRQRVMERAVIEDRLGDYLTMLREQQKLEDRAKTELADFQRSFNDQRAGAIQAFAEVQGRINMILAEQAESAKDVASTQEDRQRRKEKYQGTYEEASKDQEIRKALSIPANLTPLEKQAQLYRILSGLTQNSKATDLAKQLSPQKIRVRGKDINLKVKQGGSDWEFATPDDRDVWNGLIDQALATAREFEDFVFLPLDEQHLQEAIQKLKGLRATTMEFKPRNTYEFEDAYALLSGLVEVVRKAGLDIATRANSLIADLGRQDFQIQKVFEKWQVLRDLVKGDIQGDLLTLAQRLFNEVDARFAALFKLQFQVDVARHNAAEARRPLDHKKLLDMLIDEIEDKYIELLEGTRAHTANIDNYIKQVATALDDDFNTQFYYPAFREVRKASRYWDVNLSQIETTSILTNNRAFAKVDPEATMEFDLPKRDIFIAEAMGDAKALLDTYGALVQDPTFLALTKLRSGQPVSSPVQGASGGLATVRNVLPGIPSATDERVLSQSGPGGRQLAAPLEALIPDPAIYKFETGTGYEIRPVISPDGQSVVFHFNYMYTTNVREPVRADEKHLGRVKRHFVDTDVQLGNYELREVSRYLVALKVSRTSRGVPLLEDIPGVGVLFRPLPSVESSLQENIIMAQSTIFPTLFDLMGLRWAPAVVDLDPLGVSNEEFVARGRKRDLMNHVFDYSTSKVDEFLRIPPAERRTDLYRTQETIPYLHPNGYQGPGLNLRDSQLREGYDPRQVYPESRFVPSRSKEGAIYRPNDATPGMPGMPGVPMAPGALVPGAPPPVGLPGPPAPPVAPPAGMPPPIAPPAGVQPPPGSPLALPGQPTAPPLAPCPVPAGPLGTWVPPPAVPPPPSPPPAAGGKISTGGQGAPGPQGKEELLPQPRPAPAIKPPGPAPSGPWQARPPQGSRSSPPAPPPARPGPAPEAGPLPPNGPASGQPTVR